MANPVSSAPSFLRDAFSSHAAFSNLQKQEAQKWALRWLQRHIEDDLEDKTIIDQFAQKWRSGPQASSSSEQSPLYLENLPGSYKGEKSINSHQEEALVFIQDMVPLSMQEAFKQRWETKSKLVVVNQSGAAFKIDEREIALLKKEDADGDGTGWYLVEDQTTYYLLSSESKGDDYCVELGEGIGPENRSIWFVLQEDVKLSNV
jgi:hypothetical protein